MRRMDLSGDGGRKKNQAAPPLLDLDLDVLIPRNAAIGDASIPLVHGFYCLHEHIRERATPILENQI